MYEYTANKAEDSSTEMSNNMADSNATFPIKLYALLYYDHGVGIDWLSHGLAFRVRDTNKFINDIMPRYFKRKNKQRSQLMTFCLLMRVDV